MKRIVVSFEDKDDDSNKEIFYTLLKAPLLEFLFFKINQFNRITFFLLEDMYFLLKAKGLNDNGYILINQFD